MKKNIVYGLFTVSLIIMVEGCSKFDQINSNPDQSTTATSAWLATSMITSITSSDISSTKSFMQPFFLGKYILWTESKTNFQYNLINRGSFSRLTVLRNIAPMIAYATDAASKNSYTALGHFIRAWQFFQLTMQMGDVPYTQAIKGESDGIIKPVYDPQKTVFLGILNELDSANSLFASGSTFSGDFIYNGSTDKWRRLTNSFELYVLINLYKKTSDADLNVTARFKDIVANRPLMQSFADNFAVTYTSTAGYAYPWSNTPAQANSFIDYPMLSANLVSPLQVMKDRRLFYYAEPSVAKVASGLSSSDFNAYVGVEASIAFSTAAGAKTSKNYSDLNLRYSALATAEPVGLFNYWDLQFILAEATVRGWITGTSAETYYEGGIGSSMSFLAKYGGTTTYAHGMPLDAAYIASYLPTVSLAGTTENQIKQIITEKYLSNFLQDCDYNAWYENRRTGYPAFILNSSTNLNNPNTTLPTRWEYPSDELNYNSDNVTAAIGSQYSGNDDNNGIMWILK